MRELTVFGTHIFVTFPEMSALKTLVLCGTFTPTFSGPLDPLHTLYLTYFPCVKSFITKSELFTAEECHPSINGIEHLEVSYSSYVLHSLVEKQFPNICVLSLAHCYIPDRELGVILADFKELTELDLTGKLLYMTLSVLYIGKVIIKLL